MSVRGLQLEGVVSRLRANAAADSAQLYASRFPFVSGAPALRGALARAAYYQLMPARVLWIDSRRGLGRRVRIRLPG